MKFKTRQEVITLSLLTFMLFALNACMKSKTNKTSSSSSTSTDSTYNPGVSTDTGGGDSGSSENSGGSTNTGTNPGCYEPGVGPQINDYFNHSIIAHGNGGSGVNWSSATDPSLQTPGYQDMFRTDSRFKVRVLALSSPGTNDDNYGQDCFGEVPYGKLQVEVGIKIPGSSGYVDTQVLNDIPVDGCSEVVSFSIPAYSAPFTVEVKDVKWNYTCDVYYGCSDPNKDCTNIAQCPWDYVWVPDCFEIVLQWSVDQTKDFP